MFVRFSAWLETAAVIGLVSSTLVAILLGMDKGLIRAGLFGFNGILVGAGLSLFLLPSGRPRRSCGSSSPGSTILMATLATVFQVWNVPPFTLPFNFATLIFLALRAPACPVPSLDFVLPAEVQALGNNVETALRSVETAASHNDIEGWANAIMRGIGQLFFANDIVAGVLIIAGIAVASRIAAVFAHRRLRRGDALRPGAPGQRNRDLQRPLGFNSFDACLAIGGVFYVLSFRSAILAVFCAVATAILFGHWRRCSGRACPL